MNDMDRQQPAVDLVEVEPDLAEHVVDLLGVAGISAATAPGHGELVTVSVPSEDIERARATLDLVLPGLLAEDPQAQLPPSAPRLSGRLIRRSDWTADVAEPEAEPPGLVDGRTAFEHVLADDDVREPIYLEDDGDFIPPEPPPIPHGDVVTRFAWLGAIGGPIAMILTALIDLPVFIAILGIGAFVAGFGVLVARMPDRARQDDGWDDGAVL